MPTAGIQVWNQNDFLQIDQNYKNYLMYETRAISCNTQVSNACYADVDLPYGVDAFIGYVDSDFACHSVLSVSGSTVRYRFFKIGGPGTINIVVFRVSPPSGSTYGMQVFNAAGELVFDALMPYMRIVDFIQGENVAGVNFDYGRRVAVVQARRQWRAREGPIGSSPPFQWLYTYDSTFASASGGVVRTTYANIQVIGPNPDPQYNMFEGGSDYGAYLVLDFTSQ
jgi:hypothetical protein